MMQALLDSEPEAGMVSTTPMGRAFSTWALPVKQSHTSPSMQAPAAMALEESMALPPPMASTKSNRFSRQRRMPSFTVERRGFGTTPSYSTNSMPAALREASMRSRSPFLRR